MNTFVPFYILSAETDIHNSGENAYRHAMLWRQLCNAGLATAACKGVYKKRAEQSILVIDENPSIDATFDTVLRLAATYAQQTVLAVDANRNANLVPTDGKRGSQWIGKFVSVTEEVAKASGDYTERAGNFFVCR